MLSTASMQKRELQLLSLLMKTHSGLLKLVRARFCTQVISAVTFEARGKKPLPVARYIFLTLLVVLRGVGPGQCEHLLLVLLSKRIVLLQKNSILFKEVA